MLDKVIHFSIKNKIIIGLFTLALIIWGGYSVTKLPIDAVPDITNNQVQVITVSPSLAAEDIERLVTFPVEQTMANISGIEEVRSFSRFGLSVVTIVFKEHIDVYWARQQVNERLNEAKTIIPQGVGIPELAPLTTGLGEIYQYVIHTQKGYEKKYTAMDLRTVQDWIVRRQLLGTEGIADVSSFGGYLKQYEIALNPDKLRSMNISIRDVFTALQKNNQNTGGAYIDKKPNAYFIRSEGLIGTKEDIEKIVVKVNANGIPVLIRNVASVDFGHATRYGAMTRNNEGEVVGGIVMMLKGANSSEVIHNVKERISQIEKNLPEGVVIEPFLDRTKLVNNAIGTVTKNLAEGALIVIFVLVLLLGNFRAGLIVASVIPLAMLFAIALMNLFGVSGNLMSLGAIDFGLIVDGAVIIVEATLHHITGRRLFEKFGTKTLSQEQMDNEVYESASKIRSSAAFGEIIILIVYLPILALVGVEGKMFRPMAQTVSYVPMITSLFLNKNTQHKRNISDRIMDFFQRIYSPLIHFALKRKVAVLVTAVVMFVISVVVFMNMGGEFIPTLDEGDFAVETRVLQGSSISQTIEAALRASKILKAKFPEVKEVIGKIGSSEIPTDPMPVEACDLMIILKDKSEWTSASSREELAEKMQEALGDIPGVTFSFQQPIQMRFNELMTGAKQDVVIKIYGEDLNILTQYAKQIGKLSSTVKGAQDIYVEEMTGQSQIVVKFDRDKIAQFGLNIEDVNQVIKSGFAGESAGFVYEGEKRFDLVVRLEKDNRQNIDDIKNLFVTAPNGNQVPVSQLAEIEFKISPNQIQRDDAKRRITVGFNVRGRDVESVVKEMQQKVDKEVKFSAGYYPTYGGTFKNLIEARQRLSIAVPVALLLIFMLLFFTFHSFKQSILIFTAIPLSAIGGVFALWLRDMPFSISAGVGFIALFGVAVLNGIVLIGEFNSLKKEGMTTELTKILEEEYEPHVKDTKERSLVELQTYIESSAPRYTSLLRNPDILKSIPPNLSDDKKEEHLHRISFNARKNVEKHISDFINNKQISEDTIAKIKNDIKEKTSYDIDSLTDYMMRRKAIIDLFDKFLEADNDGKYKLEQDIHNIIFPMGLTNDEVSYESHNLWLLDERFLTYKFIASDKSITSFSQKKSSKEPDVIMLNENPMMFDNPISFGDKSNGDVNSMVIFEFKRPGETAHQKNKGNYRWEFSDLIEPYFDDFLYSPDKKNYKGKQVIIKNETPKFGFVILDVMPPLLEQYNIGKGWAKTPFGTFYKIYSGKNMHIEVMTFSKLLEYAKSRHVPFFDKLFGK
jgi:cobalt-zinc-cadmium resistance protein CzcA